MYPDLSGATGYHKRSAFLKFHTRENKVICLFQGAKLRREGDKPDLKDCRVQHFWAKWILYNFSHCSIEFWLTIGMTTEVTLHVLEVTVHIKTVPLVTS